VFNRVWPLAKAIRAKMVTPRLAVLGGPARGVRKVTTGCGFSQLKVSEKVPQGLRLWLRFAIVRP